MGPKSIFVCLQSNPKGLNLTHKAQNQFPKIQSLLLMHKLKLPRSRIDSQLPKLDQRDLSLTHSGSKSTSRGSKATPRPKLTYGKYGACRVYFKIPLLRCCILTHGVFIQTCRIFVQVLTDFDSFRPMLTYYNPYFDWF